MWLRSSRGNLRIVRDQYGEGATGITELLAAQSNLVVAEQLTSRAAYEFLIELVKLQRALAWFEIDKTVEERERLVAEIEAELARP